MSSVAKWKYLVALLLCSCVEQRTCDVIETLATYEVRLETLWDRRDFPKDYPEWRPPASWSKMQGFSHNESFHIFHKGETASRALKKFMDTSSTASFDLFSQGSNGVFDKFDAPPIGSGVGEGVTSVVAHSNYSKISMVCKMVPSPDWFIGVDGLDLFTNGKWINYLVMEAAPLDAGTDNGLTFTSPNWPTQPQEIIQAITPRHPNHPAGSFHYPQYQDLPAVARFVIKKQREFICKDDANVGETSDDLISKRTDIYRYEVNDEALANPESSLFKISNGDTDSYSNDYKSYSSAKLGFFPLSQTTNGLSVQTADEETRIEVTEPGLFKQRHASTDLEDSGFGKEGKLVEGSEVMAVMDDIVKDYQKEHRDKIRKRKQERMKRRKQLRHIKPPQDCLVSEWTDWSECSKTCGIGEQNRTRNATKPARRGGRPCPKLMETTWCGSARACKRDYFKWN